MVRARAVSFQLVDDAGHIVEANCSLYLEDPVVWVFMLEVQDLFEESHLRGVYLGDLRVFVQAQDGTNELKALDPLDVLDDMEDDALLVVKMPKPAKPTETPVQHKPEAEQREALMQMLQWKEPQGLCSFIRSTWPYQGAADVVRDLQDPLLEHYQAWQANDADEKKHPLFLALGGRGIGKSRLLREMQGLLSQAAKASPDPELVQRIDHAFVFHVTFTNGTYPDGRLINQQHPEYEISLRMLYQMLRKEYQEWLTFIDRVSDLCPSFHLGIETVIHLVAQLQKIKDLKDMTVIVCIDGLQMLINDGTTSCDLHRVLKSLCRFLNSSTAFSICVCASPLADPVKTVFSSSEQQLAYVVPPPMNGEFLLGPDSSDLEKQLVEDMGGHGCALEALQELFAEKKDELKKLNESMLAHALERALQHKYGDLFDVDWFCDPKLCRCLLAAVLSRRKLEPSSILESPSMQISVDQLRNSGLFRLTREGHLECAFVVFRVMLQFYDWDLGKYVEAITSSEPPEFDSFVAVFRRLKSMVFCDQSVPWTEFHAGARFNATDKDGLQPRIKESAQRWVVETRKHKIAASASETRKQKLAALAIPDGDSMNAIGVNKVIIRDDDGPAVHLDMRVTLDTGAAEERGLEVIQIQPHRMDKKMDTHSYAIEREHPMNAKANVFVLITPGEAVEDVELPPQCGLVTSAEFDAYFGPFASRAKRASASTLEKQAEAASIVETSAPESWKRTSDDSDDQALANKRCKPAKFLETLEPESESEGATPEA